MTTLFSRISKHYFFLLYISLYHLFALALLKGYRRGFYHNNKMRGQELSFIFKMLVMWSLVIITSIHTSKEPEGDFFHSLPNDILNG